MAQGCQRQFHQCRGDGAIGLAGVVAERRVVEHPVMRAQRIITAASGVAATYDAQWQTRRRRSTAC